MLDFHDLMLNNKDPVYSQIVTFVKRQIVLGHASSGERLPSRREIAAQLGVNPNTVQKAFKHMEEEDFVHTSGNQGSVIFFDEAAAARIEKELTHGLVVDFIASAKDMHMSFKQVMDLISEHWERRD